MNAGLTDMLYGAAGVYTRKADAGGQVRARSRPPCLAQPQQPGGCRAGALLAVASSLLHTLDLVLHIPAGGAVRAARAGLSLGVASQAGRAGQALLAARLGPDQLGAHMYIWRRRSSCSGLASQ